MIQDILMPISVEYDPYAPFLVKLAMVVFAFGEMWLMIFLYSVGIALAFKLVGG